MDWDSRKGEGGLASAQGDEDSCQRSFAGMDSRAKGDRPGNLTDLRPCDPDRDSPADHRFGWLSRRGSGRRLLSIGRAWGGMGPGRNGSLSISDDMGIRFFNPFDLVDFRDHNIR